MLLMKKLFLEFDAKVINIRLCGRKKSIECKIRVFFYFKMVEEHAELSA